MNKTEDDCYNHAKIIDVLIEFLIQQYNSLKKIDYQDDPSGEDVSDINAYSRDIIETITDLEAKIQNARSIVSKCSLSHEELKKSITQKEATVQKMKTRFLKERDEIMAFLSTYTPKQTGWGKPEEVVSKDISEYSMNELMLEEEKLQKVQEYIYEKDGLIMSEADKEQIGQLKNQIKELLGMVKGQIDQASVNLQKVDEKVDDSYDHVKRGTEELKQAALINNSTNKMTYPMKCASICCAIGTIFPGVGNAVGFALGYGIGLGIAKIEEKAIKKIGSKK